MLKRIILATSLLLAVAACSKVTADNYLKLELGMNKDEVISLLGNADECSEPTLGAHSCIWRSGEKEISVNFLGDKVAVYNKSGF
jgi:hypothetical protein